MLDNYIGQQQATKTLDTQTTSEITAAVVTHINGEFSPSDVLSPTDGKKREITDRIRHWTQAELRARGLGALDYRTEADLAQRIEHRMLGLGFLIGISPCVPLVAILTYIACTATNVLRGIAYALCFGIGTIVPVMILGPLVGLLPEKMFKSPTHLRVFKIVCGVILILFGLQLLYCTWQVL